MLQKAAPTAQMLLPAFSYPAGWKCFSIQQGWMQFPLQRFMDFPDELKPEKELFLGDVGDFVPMQICPGRIHHYQQVNLTLPQKDGRTWTVMETPNQIIPVCWSKLICVMDVPTGGAGGVRTAEALWEEGGEGCSCHLLQGIPQDCPTVRAEQGF